MTRRRAARLVKRYSVTVTRILSIMTATMLEEMSMTGETVGDGRAALAAMIAAKKRVDVPTKFCTTPIVLDARRSMFPYRDFWRGDWRSSDPIVYDRPAGYAPRFDERRRRDECETPFRFQRCACFETAPYTRLPCYDKPYGLCGCDCSERYGAR